MQDALEHFAQIFGTAMFFPNLGSAELLVAALVACGLLLIGISSFLPKEEADDLEWWERR